ncbi:MAG TPA: type II secretion system protein GspG [Candidatus Polarisedimenticolia bacterium]|nr:type II secretion system protein GspG [Candidatus Polarisedimenticolia bacterium]
MNQRGIVHPLFLLVTSFLSCAIADEGIASPPKKDLVALTMREMRIVSSFLEGQRRELGTYPAADGMLHPLREVLTFGVAGRAPLSTKDFWGHPVWYRANSETHQLISYGSDGVPDEDYAQQRLYPSRYLHIVESPGPTGDLVLIGGRFVRRPFLGRSREMETINSINAIYRAAASYAVDYNRYPGTASAFSPVTDLLPDLVPIYSQELPTLDGWGRPLLYSNSRGALFLVSYGEDGQPDHDYYPDLACGLEYFGVGAPFKEGGDVVQTCGVLVRWPLGTEP